MSNVAKLKKRALEYEQKKQFDKALETYLQVLSSLDDHVDEADVALFNRVGDLLLRDGDVSGAVDHYERAVDLYAEGGFINNAIALCNKILRNAPGRNSVYYKLGKISAQKGFINDAKQNFLEYADRMQRLGNLEEAFGALKEFADLCPDQEDIRLMLADQLARKDRREEAIEQLQQLYEKFQSEGRTQEARATVDRMKAIEPGFTPPATAERAAPKRRDLIFLEVDYDAPGRQPPRRGATPVPAVSGPRAPAASSQAPRSSDGSSLTYIEGAPYIDVPPLVEDPAVPDPASVAPEESLDTFASVDGLQHGAGMEAPSAEPEPGLVSHVDMELITGFEDPRADVAGEQQEPVASEAQPLDDIESTRYGPMSDVLENMEFELQEDPGAHPSATEPDAAADEGLVTLNVPPLAQPERDVVAGTAEPPATNALSSADAMFLESPRDSLAPPLADAAPVPRVDQLRAEIERVPDNWELHRLFGEALLEEGDREGGLAQLEVALLGYERDGDLRGASTMAEELIRVQPSSVRFHQKRVEYAVRANERPRLVEAYLALAECLLRDGEVNKSRAVYHRVLELAPDDARARSALRSVGTGDTPVPAPPRSSAPTGVRRDSGPRTPARQTPRGAARAEASSDPPDGFVNLADWLREEEPERNTRMVADVNEPRDHEQADFAEMLEMFKLGVARNVDESDFESHYDLGVAYREMGLLDEAIAEFQKALRGADQRIRTYEALGQCFVDKGQYQIALTLLSRALNDRSASDDTLVGVLYLLGFASDALGRLPDAQRFFERVFAVDIQFRDVAERLATIERGAR